MFLPPRGTPDGWGFEEGESGHGNLHQQSNVLAHTQIYQQPRSLAAHARWVAHQVSMQGVSPRRPVLTLQAFVVVIQDLSDDTSSLFPFCLRIPTAEGWELG